MIYFTCLRNDKSYVIAQHKVTHAMVLTKQKTSNLSKAHEMRDSLSSSFS